MTLKLTLKQFAGVAALTGCLILPMSSAEAGLFKRKKAPKQETALTGEAKDSAEMAKKFAGAQRFEGLFDCRLDKDGDLYFILPDSVFNHTYLLSSRVAGISYTGDLVAGQMNITPLVIRFTKDDKNVYMHLVQDANIVDPNDPIKVSFDRNMIDPVLKGFKIKHRNSGSVAIDMTAFFSGDEKLISPIKDSDPFAKMLSGRQGVEGTFYKDGSTITKVKAFPDNIIIESQLAYTTKKVTDPYTVKVSRSIMKLPDNPMKPRLQDNRVGYFYDTKKLYSSNNDKIEVYNIINRFRVEPKDEDLDAYFAGKLVEPKKKIKFYVDSAFPDKWRKAVKEGIEYWNIAFEEAGFKNVIEALDYPTDNPDFDPDDVRFNCVRYSVTPTANAMGPSHNDPRTGEILGADVIWYHNVLSLVHDWRFVQTGAVDPRVRTKTFADSVMYESLTYVTAHEVGHCLGLMHNMGASYAYTIDNLRDPAFTQKYGTTPSIMDYARNNFVAQPGDYERGVRLTPPPVGVYDINAIKWGYRLIPDTKDFKDEKPVLDKWIEEKENDPMYEFGAQQVLGTIDPTDQTEDLGNDHIKAGDMAISNLKIIMNNLEDWAGEPGEDFEPLADKYKAMCSQYLRHVGHVYPYIGGVEFKEIRQGAKDNGAQRNFIPKAKQREAMKWLLNQARTSDWMVPAKLIAKFEEPYQFRDKMQRNIVACLLIATNLQRIKEGGELDPKVNYTLPEYIAEAYDGIFEATNKGKKLDATERNMQQAAIDVMTTYSGLKPKETKSSRSLTDQEDTLSVVDEFAETMALSTLPEFPCGFSACQAHEDGDHSFFRLLLNQPPLPSTELRPMMTSLLRKTLNLYKTRRAATADAATRDFYDYQIIQINKTLNPK